MDIDLCGPSVPKMFNVEKSSIHQSDAGWIPVFVNSKQTLSVMSIGFLLNEKSEAVVWRGPKKHCIFNFNFFVPFFGKSKCQIVILPSHDKTIHERCCLE